MANCKNTAAASEEPSFNASSEIVTDVHDVNDVLVRLKGLLGELDAMGCPRAASYLSMAIDHVELDFATKSK
jgi:hypothetical protein